MASGGTNEGIFEIHKMLARVSLDQSTTPEMRELGHGVGQIEESGGFPKARPL